MTNHLSNKYHLSMGMVCMVCGRCQECMELVENMMKAVQSFYVDSRACVRVGNDLSE